MYQFINVKIYQCENVPMVLSVRFLREKLCGLCVELFLPHKNIVFEKMIVVFC